jgi:lysophospholipase L1-like esterase
MKSPRVTRSLALIAAVLVGAGVYWWYAHLTHTDSNLLYLENKNYSLQVGLHDTYPTSAADVVMLGNSLTYGVDWNELLGRHNIINRGIAGDITKGFLHRLDYVVRLHPKLCFIEGGVNDVYANVPVQTVFHNYQEIVEQLRSHDIIPIIQSVLYVSPLWHDYRKKNQEIEQLNSSLQAYALQNGITFLNINAQLSENQLLRKELTYDGLHLNAQGYLLWGREVERILSSHGL